MTHSYRLWCTEAYIFFVCQISYWIGHLMGRRWGRKNAEIEKAEKAEKA